MDSRTNKVMSHKSESAVGRTALSPLLLAEPLKATPGEFLDEPFGGPGVGGGRLEEKLSLPLKVLLSALLLLTV